MIYEYPGGSASLFSTSSQVFEVSLDPYTRVLDMPQDVFDDFAKISRGYYNSTIDTLTYPTANPPLGNLTVTLKGGYTTVIPSEELFLSPRLYNSTGDYDIINRSILVSEISNYSASGPWYWGIPYLTMNYMTMDYDKNQFSLGQVYRGDFDNLAQPICTPLCSPTVSYTGSATATATPSTGGTGSGAPGHPSSTGAIVGGAVGGVAGLILLGALLFFFMRRRRRSTARCQQPSPEQEGPPYNEKQAGSLPSYNDNTKTDTRDDINELPLTPEEDQYAHRGFSPTRGLEETHMSPNITAPLEMPAYRND